MKKILVFSNMYPSSQKTYAGIFVKNQFEYLKENDTKNQYSVYALKRTFTGKLGSIKKYLTFYYRSFSLIKKGKFELIHLHFFYPLAFIPWFFKKTRGTKVFVTVHGSDLNVKMRNNLVRKVYTFLLKDFTGIICVGQQLKEDFERIMKVPVTEVLSAGVDESVFKPLSIPKEFDFIFVGSLYDDKGFEVVLNMIEQTVPMGCKWCIIGSGIYENQVSLLVTKYQPNVYYNKNVSQSELNVLYNKSKWFFFPSRKEAFGLVASEALFAGTPVICSKIGGLVEQVFEGQNGFLLNDFNDLEEIKAILTKAFLMNNESYKAFTINCSAEHSPFSLRNVCNRLSEIYDNV